MKAGAKLPSSPDELCDHTPDDWIEWFKASFSDDTQYIQDPVHIGTKLRTRLLNEKKEIVMGDKRVCISHLKTLIDTISKDKHGLNYTDINSADKMNFKAVEKLINEEVRNNINEHIPNSEGTCEYLRLMQCVIHSFLKKDMTPNERVFNIWYSIFFLRIWRDWLLRHPQHKLENYITSNAYNCIELNGHCLLNLIRKFRDSGNHHLFQPWHFGSQPCEQFFRTLRSMSTTLSTVVNFSIRDVLYRIKKIELQEDIKLDLSSKAYNFSKRHRAYTEELIETALPLLPTNDEIYACILEAQNEARQSALKVGLISATEEVQFPFHMNFPNTIKIPISCENDQDEPIPLNAISDVPDEEILRDLEKIPNYENFNLKNFANVGKCNKIYTVYPFLQHISSNIIKIKNQNIIFII